MQWKRHRTGISRPTNSDVTAAGKLKKDAPPAQLYNLEADPYQTTNVIRQHPSVAARLKRRLQQIKKTPTRPGAEAPVKKYQ